MPRVSERNRVIRELIMLGLFASLTSDNQLVHRSRTRVSTQSMGDLMFRRNKRLARWYDMEFSDEAIILNALEAITSLRYINARWKEPFQNSFELNDMLRSRQTEFRQAMRTDHQGFQALLHLIGDHPIFHSTSHNAPPRVDRQLALTLERLGSHGNAASVGRLARNYQMGEGSVITCTRRVIKAIIDRGSHYLAWPGPERREAISGVMATEGFPGCVGFVDGTTFPIWQRPGKDGEVFFDRKKRYSINAQIICDCDRRIIGVYAGWPGSCSDVTVYGKMDVSKNPNKYFSPGEYLLADSAYMCEETVVPSFKGQVALQPNNRDFNYCVAKARIRNEHSIGILKTRWMSLQCLRLALNEASDMRRYLDWIRVCIILHNMLALLGNAWEEIQEDIEENFVIPRIAARALLPPDEVGSKKRETVRDHAVPFNYMTGVLPMK